jgi:hypothetical protein
MRPNQPDVALRHRLGLDCSTNSSSLQSLWLAFHLRVNRRIEHGHMRADYGRQLLKLPGVAKLGQVLHISMTVGY